MENLDNMMKEQAEKVIVRINAQKKKQALLTGMIFVEGLIALGAGIAVLVLESVLIGAILIALGLGITIAMSIVFVSTNKKLNTMRDDALRYVEMSAEALKNVPNSAEKEQE